MGDSMASYLVDILFIGLIAFFLYITFRHVKRTLRGNVPPRPPSRRRGRNRYFNVVFQEPEGEEPTLP
jgi:hypothetical protein